MSDSPVIAFLNKMTDLILLNALWLVCSLPVVTIGASTTAMYYVCILSIRQGDGYVVRRFFKSFRENFVKATILWLMILVLGAILAGDLFFWYWLGTPFGKVLFVLSMTVEAAFAMVCLYLFPVLAKLRGNMRQVIHNAAAFAVGYLPYTLILMILTGLFVYMNIISPGMNAISVFIGFAGLVYIKSFFLYKVFMNHIDEKYDDFWTDGMEERHEGESDDRGI